MSTSRVLLFEELSSNNLRRRNYRSQRQYMQEQIGKYIVTKRYIFWDKTPWGPLKVSG
jgi:hypothetical protein